VSVADEPASEVGVADRARRTVPALLAGIERPAALRAGTVAMLFLLVLLALPELVSAYWVEIATSVGIYSIVTLSQALLVGRVGMVSLGQIALLAVGGWIALRLGFGTSLPFPLMLLVTGLITSGVGVLIGLPALRLSGLYLALITLMAAAAITVVLQATNFPNGGSGFTGYSGALAGTVSSSLHRPALLASSTAFFRAVVIVAALMFLLAVAHVRSRAGRAWAAIRQSEPSAVAAGVNVTLYKMWAFALASFMTGVAGGLLASSSGGLSTYAFPAQDSITVLAVVLMGGVFSFWGPIVAALLLKLLPELLKNWGLPPDLLTILFGLGVLQVMLTAPAGLAVQVPRDLANLTRLIRGRLAGGGAGAAAR
jgi:branched-chain amino acid transport system permease protein